MIRLLFRQRSSLCRSPPLLRSPRGPPKGCPSYRKSIKREKLEGEFEDVLQRLQPAENLFVLVKAMFRNAWDMRLAKPGRC